MKPDIFVIFRTFSRYLEKKFRDIREKNRKFSETYVGVIFVSRPRSALKRYTKISVRKPSVRSEQHIASVKIFIETFLECSSDLSRIE